jgi:hypothetical protein
MLEVNRNHGGDAFSSALNDFLDVPIATKEGPTPLGTLAAQAMQHPYTQYMHNQPQRLASFPYNDRRRLADFGANIDPALHGIYIMRGTAAVIACGRLDGEKIDADNHEIAVSLLGVMVHDFGEHMHPEIKKELGFVLGDIPHGKKTDVHREKEKEVFFFTVPRTLPSLPESTIQSIWDLVSHKDKDRATWRPYEADHKGGEIEPGISASHKLMVAHKKGLINPDAPGHRKKDFARYAEIAKEVIKSHGDDCKQWAQEFNFVNQTIEGDYGEMIKWHEETGGFSLDDDGFVVVPEGYEKVLEKTRIDLPRSIGDLAVFGYNGNRPAGIR